MFSGEGRKSWEKMKCWCYFCNFYDDNDVLVVGIVVFDDNANANDGSINNADNNGGEAMVGLGRRMLLLMALFFHVIN